MQPVSTATLMRRCDADYIARWRESRALLDASGRRHRAIICTVLPLRSEQHNSQHPRLSIVLKCSNCHVADMSENPTFGVLCRHLW
jgi:hypothetical protein